MFELVYLIEDDDGSRAIVVLEPIDEFVMWCRLPVDVNSRADVVEDLVERSESGVVPPAVDVGRLDVENLFAESFGDELRDAGFTGTAWSCDDGGVGGFTAWFGRSWL